MSDDLNINDSNLNASQSTDKTSDDYVSKSRLENLKFKDPKLEDSKRRKEIFSVVPVLFLFIVLTWFQFRLFAISDTLPFYYAIFFFGLVNINLIIFLVLLFLIFRNLVKVYSETKIPIFGRTLKAKLIIAFFTFAFVPTFLMFLVSIFYINSSFDRWFALKGMGILDDSIQISELYYKNIKREGYFFSNIIFEKLQNQKLNQLLKNEIKNSLNETPVDAIEIYDLSNKNRWLEFVSSIHKIKLPEIDINEFKTRISPGLESSVSLDIPEGRLLRTLKISQDKNYLIVVNRIIPSFLVDQFNNIIEARDDYRGSTPFEFPLKTIYIITLVLMTLVILLGGTWFGLYLAGQLSASLELLGQATREIARGKYLPIEIRTGSYEVERLVKNFNLMSKKLQRSTEETALANFSLKSTLIQLEESKNYIQTVVENVSTCIITIDINDKVTFLNTAAKHFFKFRDLPYRILDHEIELPRIILELFEDLKVLSKNSTGLKTQEKRILVNNKPLNLNCGLSMLFDDKNNVSGYIFGFEDVTVLANAQRAEAWAEVATRVAHEIKNPLTPIKLSAERLQKKYPNIDPQTFEQCTQMIIQQVDLVKNLVNEFSHHARLPKLSLTQGSLNQLIQNNIWVYQQKLKTLDLKFSADESLPEFFFDSDQLKRIVINLLDNAVDACKSQQSPQIRLKTQLLPNKDQDLVRVEISDNGPGIDKEVESKLFQPNYTTKSSGTGLGLSIVKKMVEDHAGTIGLEQNLGVTTFYFIIPVKTQG